MRRPEAKAGRAIVVMGVSGSGKSTLAAALAGAFGCAFLEGDDYHSAEGVAKMRGGEALTDGDRWPWLDRLGAAIGARVAADGCAVAACSALKRAYRDRLRAAIGGPATFILPIAGREELARRMANRPGHYMPPSLLDSQFATLEQPDEDEGVMLLDGALAPDRLVAEACAWLARSAGG